jgi:hypothetical protein
MQELKASTPLAAGVEGDWVAADGITNIIAGADTHDFHFESRNAAGETIVHRAIESGMAETSKMVYAAYEVRVVAGAVDLNYRIDAHV